MAVHDDGTTSNEDRLGAVGDLRLAIEEAGLEDDELVVLAGDNLFDFSLLEFVEWWRSKSQPSSAVALHDVGDLELAKQYGIADTDADDRIVRFVEKPSDPVDARRRRSSISCRRSTSGSSRPTSTRGRARTTPAASSAGSPSVSRSTAIASRAPGTTSGIGRSCSRRTTGCGGSPGLPERESYSLD